MVEKSKKKSTPEKDRVEVLGETYEKGKPEGEEMGRWRQKLASRTEKLKYLRTAERYWFGKDWFGSEKRKTPA
jgi:hypothetical protein